jgi:hypothetical protein
LPTWSRKVGILLDHKAAYSNDSECTELLGCFSPPDANRAVHTKNSLEPIYATKQEVNQYCYCQDLISITEVEEIQAMMEMVKT